MLWAAVGCSDEGTAAPPPPASDVVSKPGIIQVGDDDGPVLGERETCQRFRSGLAENLERLSCDQGERSLLECPELIRPLTALSCVVYSEESLETCLEAFDTAADCETLLPGACVLTAVTFQQSPDCADAAADPVVQGEGGVDAQVGVDGGDGQTSVASSESPDGATTSSAVASSDVASSDVASSDGFGSGDSTSAVVASSGSTSQGSGTPEVSSTADVGSTTVVDSSPDASAGALPDGGSAP